MAVRTNAENAIRRCSSGTNHIFVQATPYPSLPLSSAFGAHSCLVFRPHNLIFHSNRFTCSTPSPFPLSLSLSLTLSVPIFGLILSSLISFIPSNPHLSSLADGEEKERVFPQVSCIQSVGGTCGRHREKEKDE